MKTAVFHGKDDIRIEESVRPGVDRGDVLVQVKTCGLCGTDLSKYRFRLVEPPAVLGHEIAGDVIEVGEGVSSVDVGDRIILNHHVPCFTCDVCRRGHETMCEQFRPANIYPGGFAEFVKVSGPSAARGVVKIPESVGYDEATLAEPAACCLRALESCGLKAGDSIAIIGCGTAGMLHVQIARTLGAETIIASDLMPHRLKLAQELGADVGVNPAEVDPVDAVREATRGRGADIVVVAVPSAELVSQSFEMVGRGGTVVVFAETPPGSRVQIDPNITYHSEVTLMGSYSSTPVELPVTLGMIKTGAINAEKLITNRLSLDRTQEAFDLACAAEGVLKVVVNP